MPVVNNNKTKTASGDVLGTVDFYGTDGSTRVLAAQLRCVAVAQAGDGGVVPARLEFLSQNLSGTLTEVLSAGYSVTNTATQTSNKTNPVTLSTLSGQITTHNASLTSNAVVSFVLTNTFIAAGDVLALNHVSGGTVGAYSLNAACGAGSATISIRNLTAAPLGEALVIGFALVRGTG